VSVWAQSWAYEQRAGSAGAKAVLVALAVFADEDGRCFPSQERIAGMTEQTARSVRTHLANLEAIGLMRREHRRRPDGTYSSDAFVLLAPEERLRPHIPAPEEPLRQILPLENISAGEHPAENRDRPAEDISAGGAANQRKKTTDQRKIAADQRKDFPAEESSDGKKRPQPAENFSAAPPTPPYSEELLSTEPSEEPSERGAPARASPRSRPIPNPFSVTKEMWQWADGKGMEREFVKRETEKFVAHFRSTGGTKRDWTAAWYKWLLTAQDNRGYRRGA
jgi:hypothetical protein